MAKSNEVQVSKHGQNAYYTEYLHATLKGVPHKLRLEIKTDPYKNQQRAEVLRHDGSEWKMVAYIQPVCMKSSSNLAYKQGGPSVADFDEDREKLVELAVEVLTK